MMERSAQTEMPGQPILAARLQKLTQFLLAISSSLHMVLGNQARHSLD